jgi:hypothetical protein
MASKRYFRLLKILSGAAANADDEIFLLEGRLERFVHFWVLVVRQFVRHRCLVRASALSYSTLIALIPLLAADRQWTPAASETVALEVRHYGEAPGKLALYDDDGETFDYEKGEYSWTRLAASKDGSGTWHGTVTPDANGRKWHYSEVKWTFLSGR